MNLGKGQVQSQRWEGTNLAHSERARPLVKEMGLTSSQGPDHMGLDHEKEFVFIFTVIATL